MTRFVAAALGLALGLSAGPAWAQVDWSGYDRLLRTHVREGVVDYAAFAAARPTLTALTAAIAEAEPAAEGSRDAQLAAWINAYNALTIMAVLDRKSPASLLGRLTFFKTDRYRAFGRTTSLHDLENTHIRPTFRDPRVHFALVCASKSCPKLRSEAYAGPRLAAQLDDQGRWFLASPARNQFDAATKTARLSMIFKWYAEDFERAAGSVPKYLQAFAPAHARPWIASPAAITYLDYDWSLNGTP